MDPAYWIYTVLLDPSIDRDRVIADMGNLDIHTGVIHVPHHPYDCFKEAGNDLINTNRFAAHQISLPCGWWLSEKDVKYIADSLTGVVNRQ